MSLETQIANLVAATNQLTGEVSGKMAAINQTVDAKKAELDAWRNGARAEYPTINVLPNNLLWSGAVAGAESGTAGVKGELPAGFYAWCTNVEIVIQGLRDLVDGEHGFTRPYYCPLPKVLRVRAIPRPGTSGDNGGQPVIPLPLAWGYPMPVAGRWATLSVHARLAGGAMTGNAGNSQKVDINWKKVVYRAPANDSLRAYYGDTLGNITEPIDMEFMLPHAFLGYIPDAELPVYAKAVQML